MIGLALLVAGVVGALLGRILHGRWFNHVTVYSVIWASTLTLTVLGLIHYYRISGRAWAFIILAWVEIVLGATLSASMAPTERSQPPEPRLLASGRSIATIIYILCGLAAATLVLQWLFFIRHFGGFFAAILATNSRYQLRLAGESAGAIPYVGAFALAASALAGVSTARTRRVGVTTVLPLLIVTVQGITTAGRTDMGIAAVLFGSCLILTPRGAHTTRVPASEAMRRTGRRRVRHLIFISAVVGTILMGGFTLVSATRGLVVDLPGIDPKLSEMEKSIPVLPALYAHFSASPVAFSEYLQAGAPRVPPGSYTFAPLVRFMAHLGIGPGVPYYEEQYYTPVPTNVCTYLKNVYAEYGPAGIVLFPFLLSAALTWLQTRGASRGRTASLVLLAHGLAVITFSFSFNVMVLGNWFVSAVAGTAVAAWSDGRVPAHHRVEAVASQ